ncbi:hypothetical protein BDV96DRAFT_203265 [Lophiotrema nucula]|uniref:Uncharacterized protein n=1 Tax=Lophiotrema nucula TaxID=690887 RepID=A0A6A5ZQE8_9PLEO|nr:hypothetical protein BDV96DRAFT_203265 [Lophiotrema nucula]
MMTKLLGKFTAPHPTTLIVIVSRWCIRISQSISNNLSREGRKRKHARRHERIPLIVTPQQPAYSASDSATFNLAYPSSCSIDRGPLAFGHASLHELLRRRHAQPVFPVQLHALVEAYNHITISLESPTPARFQLPLPWTVGKVSDSAEQHYPGYR